MDAFGRLAKRAGRFWRAFVCVAGAAAGVGLTRMGLAAVSGGARRWVARALTERLSGCGPHCVGACGGPLVLIAAAERSALITRSDLVCDVKGLGEQPARVRSKKLSVRLGSYLDIGRGDSLGEAPGTWAQFKLGRRACGPQRE
jgi:hypothetical protein